MEIKEREWDGHVKVTVSEQEVRVWVCNKKGMSVLRVKAMGKIFAPQFGDKLAEQVDVTIMPSSEFQKFESDKTKNITKRRLKH